jgi:ribose transport system permease protein
MSHSTIDAPAPLPTPAAATTRRLRLPARGILLANIALVLVSLAFLNVNVFKQASTSTLTPILGVMILVALGQAFIIGTGGIDLSIPATITLVGVVLLKVSGGTNGKLLPAIVACLVACLAIGLLNGFLVEVVRLNALVVTLATGQLISGLTQMYRGPVPSVSAVPDRLSSFVRGSALNVSVVLLLALLVSVFAALWLKFHVSGRSVSASSVARAAADFSGLHATRQRVVAWMVGSFMVGVGAVLLAGQITTPDLTLGDPYLLTSVVAVVLGGASVAGGRVRVAGTLFGAVFIIVLDFVFRVRGLSSGLSLAVQGAVLAVGLILVITSKTRVRWLNLVPRREHTAGSSLDPARHKQSQE